MKIAILTYAKDHFKVEEIDRLIQVGQQRGHDMMRVRYHDCVMGVEDNRSFVRWKEQDISDVDAVIPRIIQGDFEYGISLLRHFEALGVLVINDASSIMAANDKWRTTQQLLLGGVPVPDTYYAIQQKPLRSLMAGIDGERYVVKLTDGSHGSGVFLADSHSQVASLLEMLYKGNGYRTDIVIQEFIAESAGTDIRAFVVGGKVIASMQRQSLDGDFRSNLSRGGIGKKVTLTVKEKKIALDASQALGLQVAGVDIVRSNRGSLVIEVNASPGFGIEVAANCDVATPIIVYAEQSVISRRKNKYGKFPLKMRHPYTFVRY